MWPSGQLNFQGLCQTTAAERDSAWEVTHSLILIDAHIEYQEPNRTEMSANVFDNLYFSKDW